MRSLAAWAAICLILGVPVAVRASDRSDIIGVIQAYNDAGNRADRAGYASYCTADAVVLDHVPPYRFQGPTACADEYDAVVAWGARRKVDAMAIYEEVEAPAFLEIDGDAAYGVFPMKAWFTEDGQRRFEPLYLTVALHRLPEGWRMTSVTYASFGWGKAEP
jgi:ketosteroid isomerase-like protein